MRLRQLIEQENFYWFLKEYEWRFNGGNHQQLLQAAKILVQTHQTRS
jgi:transposase